jgi:hypothetical protein
MTGISPLFEAIKAKLHAEHQENQFIDKVMDFIDLSCFFSTRTWKISIPLFDMKAISLGVIQTNPKIISFFPLYTIKSLRFGWLALKIINSTDVSALWTAKTLLLELNLMERIFCVWPRSSIQNDILFIASLLLLTVTPVVPPDRTAKTFIKVDDFFFSKWYEKNDYTCWFESSKNTSVSWLTDSKRMGLGDNSK